MKTNKMKNTGWFVRRNDNTGKWEVHDNKSLVVAEFENESHALLFVSFLALWIGYMLTTKQKHPLTRLGMVKQTPRDSRSKHLSPKQQNRREERIAKNPKAAYDYANDVLHAPFPAGEPDIAASAFYAYYYAKDILRAPFPLGEPALASDAFYAYDYAKYVLHGPFPTGEPAIAAAAKYAYRYAQLVLQGERGRQWLIAHGYKEDWEGKTLSTGRI